jgi:protein-L-isoaspartate(D-aspartate) O-methyltransferase
MNIEQARFNMIEQQIRPVERAGPGRARPAARGQARTVRAGRLPEPGVRRYVEIPLPGGEAMFNAEARSAHAAGTRLKKHETVLEIGAGSGYMAALLAHKARHVTTVEIEPEIKALAEQNLASRRHRQRDVNWATARKAGTTARPTT